MNRETVELETFETVLMREKFYLPIITVYQNPQDFPDKFVARLFDVDQPTPYTVVKDSLKEVRQAIPQHVFYKIPPMESDDPSIIEVWV